MTDSSSDQAPIPFITVDDDDKFHVNPDAVAYLRSLTGRVAVISIAGLYRTGKSLLLNLLMGRSGGSANGTANAGFVVGPTVKACTKGLWLWGKAIKGSEGDDIQYLFIDTEGLGSTVRSETYDCRVFALTVLLSSLFMYNSFGTIDGNAISKLSLIVNLTKHIHVRALPGGKEDTGSEFASFFPSLVWVVRDFTVRLERDGRRISAREYLEDALKPEDGMSEAAEQKNAVRMLLRSFFPERDCVTMVRPAADEKALMQLGELGWDALRPEFRSQVEVLRKKIFGSARAKSLYGKPLSGAMLASLATAYVQALNSNAAPTISTAWDRVVEQQCADAVEGALHTYTSRLREACASASKRTSESMASLAAKTSMSSSSSASLPSPSQPIVEDDDMQSAHTDASAAAYRYYHAHAVATGGGQESGSSSGGGASAPNGFDAALQTGIASEYSKVRSANDAASTAYCASLLDALSKAASAQLLGLRQAAADRSKARAAGNSGGGPKTGAGRGKGDGGKLFGRAAAVRRKQERRSYDSDEDDDGSDSDGGHDSAGEAAAADDDGAAAAAIALVQSTSDALVPPSTLAKTYRQCCDALQDQYNRSARGPARHRVLADHMSARMPLLLLDASSDADASLRDHLSAHASRAGELSRELASCRAREAAAAELLEGEKRSKEASLAEAARQASDAVEKLRFQVSGREEELGRLSDKYDRAVAAFEAHSVRADEAAATMTHDLAGARARVEELLRAKITGLMEIAVMSQRLADAERRRGDLEKDQADLRARLDGEVRNAAVMVERVRAAENETVRLREQTELLYEANRVAKELLGSKVDEKEEAEYQVSRLNVDDALRSASTIINSHRSLKSIIPSPSSRHGRDLNSFAVALTAHRSTCTCHLSAVHRLLQWGVSKAKVASLEGDRMALEADLNVAESLASHLKALVVKEKSLLKKLQLDKAEQRKYDSLPLPGQQAAVAGAGSALTPGGAAAAPQA